MGEIKDEGKEEVKQEVKEEVKEEMKEEIKEDMMSDAEEEMPEQANDGSKEEQAGEEIAKIKVEPSDDERLVNPSSFSSSSSSLFLQKFIQKDVSWAHLDIAGRQGRWTTRALSSARAI